jgi:hypothetical protein
MHSYESGSSPARLPVLAIAEWLMVLPAIVFLAAAVLRGLQPAQYEPARTSGIIFAWFAQMPPPVVAGLLIGLPGVVALVGCVTVFRIWQKESGLRQDAATAFAILQRQAAPCLLVTATLLAGAILTLVVSHLITD